MSIKEYPRNLEILAQQHLSKYLDAGSKELLIERARALRSSFQGKKKKSSVKWSFVIPRDYPLTFKINDVDSKKLQVDISCEIEGQSETIHRQNVLLRIWSWDKDLSYREGVDADHLKVLLEKVGWRRVILRFHFDLKDPKAKSEPLYHLHIGGNPLEDEHCWLPKQIKVPRFPFPPMDIILLSEFILVNFFNKQSEQLRMKPEWESLVRKSQNFFQKEYFENCTECINRQSSTLLGNLIKVVNEA